MKLPLVTFCLVLGCCALCGSAQTTSPYAGEESSEIKALSPDEVQDYLAGEGMGLAKAAELNGYPGPAHVLELAEPLELTPDQRARTEALFTSMQSRAQELGRALVEEERKLDRMFASGSVTPEALGRSLRAIGSLQAQVRGVHLEAHIAQANILTAEQIRHYAELRGYRGTDDRRDHDHRHGP